MGTIIAGLYIHIAKYTHSFFYWRNMHYNEIYRIRGNKLSRSAILRKFAESIFSFRHMISSFTCMFKIKVNILITKYIFAIEFKTYVVLSNQIRINLGINKLIGIKKKCASRYKLAEMVKKMQKFLQLKWITQ